MAEEEKKEESSRGEEASEEGKEEPKFEYCESCGLRMMKPEDHGGSDPENKWCFHCCEDDGTHKDKEKIRERIKGILQSHDAYTVMGERPSDEDAENLIDSYMKKMPAWMTEEERKAWEEENS